MSTPSTWRGGEQQLAYLLEELPALGIEPALFCPQDSPLVAFTRARDIPCFTFRRRGGNLIRWGRMLGRTSYRFGADVLHAHDSKAHSLAVIAQGLPHVRTPVVVSRRVDFVPNKTVFSRWKYNHHAVRAYLCISQAIAQIMRTAIRQPDKVHVVPSGIDLNRPFPPAHGRLRHELGLNADNKSRPLIGNVAALAPHKDHITFVNTARVLVHEMGIDAHFVLIGGDGGEEKRVRQYIQKYQLQDRFHLLGFRQDVSALLADFDLFLFTSKTEGLGTAVLDAFKCRIPVVATNAGGIPESVIHEKTGLIAGVGDARGLAEQVQRLLTHAEWSEKVVQGALEHLRRFDKSQMAQGNAYYYKIIFTNEP